MTYIAPFSTLRFPNQFNRRRIGSRFLTTSNSVAITTGKRLALALDERYLPYDNVLIINYDTSNHVTLILNYNILQPLPAGDKHQCNIPIRSIEIQNDGTGTISANKIKVFYRKDGEGQEIFNHLYQAGNIIKGFL